jgi:Tfp pilus assembly protein PilF
MTVKKTASLLALGTASLALGGCQALFGSQSFASRAPVAESALFDMSDYFTARLEAGRTHLARGRPAAAVTAFRQASYDPAHAGRAFNGMGVAYAQMGRQDLAQRYFTMAVAADPQDQRFRAQSRTVGKRRSWRFQSPGLRRGRQPATASFYPVSRRQ